MFGIPPPENFAIYEVIQEMWWSHTGNRWQCKAIHAHCMLDK